MSMNRQGIFASMALAAGTCTMSVIGVSSSAGAVASNTVARYEMNEAVGSTTLIDTSGNGLNGTIGTEVTTNAVFNGSTGHRYSYLAPDTPPAHPQHLDKVNDNTLLDPGTSDFAVTVRYRTTRSFGNLIQKGQNADAGGYFKIELPAGNITCLFKDSTGRQRAMTSPLKYNDGQWHVIRCERLGQNQINLYVDGVLIFRITGAMTNINNTKNLSIAGKSACDQITVSCDYFVGDIDYVQIEKGATPSNTPPTAAFTQTCTALACTFNGTSSTDPGGSIVTYSWNFGDSTPAGSGATPSHTYATGGTKNVSLTVTDNGGATNTVTRQVTVIEPNTGPTAAFTVTCADFSCTFDATGSTDPQNNITTYSWDFGDGSPAATGSTVSHPYTPGHYDPVLTVTDIGTLSDTETHAVDLADNVEPTASFTVSCVDELCSFDASGSSDPNGPIASYAWDFGDTGTDFGVTTTHMYADFVDYGVTLTVTDGQGLTGTATGTASPVQTIDNITFVGQSSASANEAFHVTKVPATVQPGDALLMFFSTGTSTTVSTPTGVTGWVLVDTVTNTTGTTRLFKKVAAAGDANTQVRINVSPLAKANIMIVAYRGTSATDPVASFARLLQTNNTASRITPTAPVAGTASWAVSYWMHRDSSSTALVPPAGVTPRSTGNQSGGGRVTTLLADSGAAVPSGTYGGLTATANTASSLGTTWTIILAPA